MRKRLPCPRSLKVPAAAILFLVVAMVVVPVPRAMALIMGGTGNKPIPDPGWPKGAALIFNHPSRIAWWEGPPFGGGQWHAECRGDAKALSAVLADFAELDVKNKRLILHNGVGHSFWLNPNRKPQDQATAKTDWIFMVWVKSNWERLRKLPGDLRPSDAGDVGEGPPAQIDVYTGGNLRWSDVTVPKELKVIDQRLEAHGFTPADGIVLEGKIVDLVTRGPLAARVQLQRVEPQQKGGYQYPVVVQVVADAAGHWVIKKTPAGWYRVVMEADGYVARVAGYARIDDQPAWYSYNCGLTRPASVSGRITDDAGKPLADVTVRLSDVVAGDGEGYEAAHEYTCPTDADGRFHLDQVPVGKAAIWLHKSGYCRPGLGQSITPPVKDVALSMIKAAEVRVTVHFAGPRPGGYIVEIKPEGGDAVGTWGGSGNINAQNQIVFQNVPPGKYVVSGHPNPSSGDEKTPPQTIELKGGETTEVKLSAK